MTTKIGFIGGGVMAEALLSRLLAKEIYQPGEVLVSDPQATRRSFLKQEYGVAVTSDNQQTFTSASEVVMLAVKPQVFGAIAPELSAIIGKGHSPVVVSILAGVSLKQLETAFPQMSLIRAMPNTPATVGAGMTAVCANAHTTSDQKNIAQQMFSTVGEVVEVPESLMDAVTGVSGSGPAYVALMVEALADGGVASGLPRAIAYQLAIQTVLGAAQLLQETKIHPAELKDRVTSPGGTTIAGITQLERAGFRSAVIEAVRAATQRSQELGNG